jgi:transposase
MPPSYVKPYVKRQKNDKADAEVICEAVTRTNMRFVPIKTPEQQSGLMLHRTRHLFIRQRTSVINAIRAHLAEFGIVAPIGRKGPRLSLELPYQRRVSPEPRYKAAGGSFPDRYGEFKGRVQSTDSRLQAILALN